MKKTFTFSASLLAIFLISFNLLYSQNTVTTTVAASGADYPSIKAAIQGKQGTMSNNDILIINVAAGTLLEPVNQVYGLTKPLKVTIKGAGANSTIIKSSLNAAPTSTDNIRMVQYNTPAASGSVISFEDLKFLYWGGYGVNTAGGVINVNNPASATTPMIMTIAFKNVIFEECVSASLVNSWMESTEFDFNNCLFINCATIIGANQSLQGLISKPSGGKLTVRNTTFMSNKIQAIAEVGNPRVTLNGGMINVITAKPDPMVHDTREGKAVVILENNAFINNQLNALSYDSVYSVIGFKPDPASVSTTVTMNNNISIGNVRSNKKGDNDLYYYDKNITFSGSGNIMNKAIKRYEIAEVPGTFAFVNAQLDGFKFNDAYTYTHANINFIMENDLPKLTPDDYGIGKVSYTGNGGTVKVNKIEAGKLSINSYNNMIKVAGLNKGEKIEIYRINGMLHASKIAQSSVFEISVPIGFYIVKTGIQTVKVMVY